MAENRVLKLMEQSPLPQMVQSLSQSVADAQNALTMKAVESLMAMADQNNGVVLPGETQKRSLLELGFEPSFLHISEATITARVAFTQVESSEYHVNGSITASYGILSASVTAGYANKYSFETQGSSEIKTKIVTVPAPLPLSERLKSLSKRK